MQYSLKFLHSMRRREFLESALAEGLMLTEHKVHYKPANDFNEWQSLIDSVFPLIKNKLTSMGVDWHTIPEVSRNNIMSGICSMSGNIPMLCFTEVPEGRKLNDHHLMFGAYGLVVEREWLEINGGDRVLYIGQNSSVSKNLFTLFANLLISCLCVDLKGQVLFNTQSYTPILKLLAHIEVRDNLNEFEWRIAGHPGFLLGGKNESCKRIHLPLEKIESILVQEASDIAYFEQIIISLAKSQSAKRIPVILCQPCTLSGA